MIVGAGVIGLACAHALKKAGAEVVVVDRDEPGLGSSYGNAGWIVPSLAGPMPAPGLGLTSLLWLLERDSPLYISLAAVPRLTGFLWSFWRHCNRPDYLAGQDAVGRLGRSTMKLFDELEREGTTFEMHRDGLIFVFRDERKIRAVADDLRNMEPHGYRVGEPPSTTEVRELEPSLAEDVAGGLYIEQERHVRPETLVQGLLARVEALGVEVRTHTEVVGVLRRDGSVIRLETTSGGVEGDVFVIAAGAWSGPLCRRFGISIPVQAAKGYSVTFDQPAITVNHPLYLVESKVGVTSFDAALRLAGTLELSGINQKLDRRRTWAIRRNAASYLPGLSPNAQGEEWVGMRPLTPDGLPVIGRAPGLDDLYLATGHAMLGITLAPATAAAITELVLTGNTTLDLRPFDPARFGAGARRDTGVR